MMDEQFTLDRWLPSRLETLHAMEIALGYYTSDQERARMEIRFDGELVIEGTAPGFIYPTLESGVINARVLLEFMGLCVDKHGRLANVSRRRPDDIGIEDFKRSGKSLPLVRPSEAIARYRGPPQDAEASFLAIFNLANKALAHMTRDVASERWPAHVLKVACIGIPALLESYLYTPLGLPFPRYRHTSRPCAG